MPKKKGHKFGKNQDFTINDSANAPKPVNRVKKSAVVEKSAEASWDDLANDDFDIVEELNEDGTKNLIYKKKKRQSKSETEDTEPGCFYPEILWYLVSLYVKPEDVCRFALINKATYAITKRESFWRNLYKQHCDNHPKLPARLRLENSFTTYGLRQRVIRALHHTYNVFITKMVNQESQDNQSYLLIKRRCINIWYEKSSKSPSYWLLYLKLKRNTLHNGARNVVSNDFLTELGRIDANPDEDCKVLEVTCKSGTFQNEISPLMGMTLSTVTLVLSQGFMDHKLRLGFNSGAHNISRNILPECSVVIDKVVRVSVYDWWHVKYPFNNRLPAKDDDVETQPMLKEGFFKMTERDY